MANEEKTKVSVTKDVKREIDLLAANEQRPVYILVEEMVEMYKSAKAGKKTRVDVVEVIRRQSPPFSKKNVEMPEAV